MGMSLKEKLEAKARERAAQAGTTTAPKVEVNDTETLKKASKSGLLAA
jgi:hypothetical protein